MRNPRDLALIALSLLSTFLLGCLTQQWLGGSAMAQQGPYGGGSISWNQDVLAATGTVGSGMSVLWLVDTKKRRLAVYGTSSMGKDVELRAARNIEWDFKLDEYNDVSQYNSDDLERMWRKQQEDRSGKKKKGPIRQEPGPQKDRGEK
jgi:hypothetical protein